MDALAALLAIVLLVVAAGGSARDQPVRASGDWSAAATSSAAAAAPFAVVELFTSEGCSSCPPADRLLGEIAAGARGEGKRVFGLAFHIDYWNGLGWRDPFSNASFTHRQSDYVAALDASSIYTPQMIVNGARQFVGSSRDRAEASIHAALARPAAFAVKLHLDSQGTLVRSPGAGRRLRVRYEVSPATGNDPPVKLEGTFLQVALVEGGLTSHVQRGENRGRTLHHENVVRDFESVELDANGEGAVEIELADSLVRAHSSLIAFVQDRVSMAVLGATSLDLAPAGADASR